MHLKFHIIFCLLLFNTIHTFAQETKEDIEKKAIKHFQNEEFLAATPLYLRLLSLEPRNPNYNYRYGTCLLFNSDEKQKAFKYLNFATQKQNSVDDEAYYYLGKAYHLTYQFHKAIENYEYYKTIAGNRALAKLNVDRQIQMCKNGQSLMANISETIVLNKTKIDKESFFRIYNLSDIGGELIVTSEFQNKQDKKLNHTPLIHFPANSNRIYYSSYGKNNATKDIYVRTRLPDGSWSLEQPIFGDVNTKYNEDFPYMHPSGKYLYFSSEGHNSMGGYDIFRAPYDAETNSFGTPENMDISISSPDNDILYIVDSLDRFAYFASQRESEADKVHVYHVRVERFPVQMVILKGQFNSTIDPTQKKITISVENMAGKNMGTFKTDATGGYLINLPKGGKYKFSVKVGDKTTQHRQEIEIPYLKEFRPLKQAISETKKEDQEIVLFKNLFDERFKNEGAIIAEAIKAKSMMEVNKDQFDLDSLDDVKENRAKFDELGLSVYTNLEIHDLIKSKNEDLKARIKNTEVLINKSKQILNQGANEVIQYQNQADSLLKLAKNSTSDRQIKRYTQASKAALNKAEEKQKEIEYAKTILSFLEDDLRKHKALYDASKHIVAELNDIQVSDTEALKTLLLKNEAFISEKLQSKTRLNAEFEFLEQIEDQLKIQNELIAQQKETRNNIDKWEAKLNQLLKEQENAPKRKKDDYNLEISKTKNLISDLNNELDYVEEQLNEIDDITEQKKILHAILQESFDENLNPDEFNNYESNQNTDQQNQLAASITDIAERNNVDLSPEAIANRQEAEQMHSENDDAQKKQNTNTVFNSESKNKTLTAIDSTYFEDIERIENKIQSNEASIEALIKRKTNTLQLIEAAKREKENELKNNVDNEELSHEIKNLNQLEQEINKEINQLKNELGKNQSNEIANTEVEISAEDKHQSTNNKTQEKDEQNSATFSSNEEDVTQLNNSVIEEQKSSNSEPQISSTAKNETLLIAEIDPEYEQDIIALEKEVQAGTKTNNDIIERKRKFVVVIGDMESAIESKSNQDPSEEQEEKLTALSKLKVKTENEIHDLEQLDRPIDIISNAENDDNSEELNKQTELEPQRKNEILEAANPQFNERVESLLNDFYTGEAVYDELIFAYEVHKDKLEQALNNDIKLEEAEEKVLQEELQKTNQFLSNLKHEKTQDQERFIKIYKELKAETNLNEQQLKSADKTPQTTDEAEQKLATINVLLEATHQHLNTTNDDFEIRHLNTIKKDLTQKRKAAQFEFGELTQHSIPKTADRQALQDELEIEITESQFQIFKALYEERYELHLAEEENPELATNKRHQKKVNKNEDEIANEKQKILNRQVNAFNDYLTSNVVDETPTKDASTSALLAQQEIIKANNLIEEANSEEDPQKKKQILQEAKAIQDNAAKQLENEKHEQAVKTVVSGIIDEEEYTHLNLQNALKTEKELQKEKTQIGIKRLKIKDEINNINANFNSANKKEKKVFEERIKNLKTIDTLLSEKEDDIQNKLNEIKTQKKKDANKGVPAEAIKEELTYLEEVEIAQSEAYKALLNNNNKLNQLQFELLAKEKQLDGEREELQQITANVKVNKKNDESQKIEIEKQLSRIDKTLGEIKVIRQEIRSQQEILKQKLDEEREQKEKIENMIARDVAPIKEAPTLPTIPTGLQISNTSQNNYSDENPIPLDIEAPKGLVFRVQIGAFSKPVPNNTFTEFSPITGDVVRPGLIRYVAGFFNSRNSATTARNKIREMGYSDAFVVAYCDGDRIPVYRALELMRNGACVPTLTETDEVIVSTEEITPTNATSFEKVVDEFAYNKAPGAAEADVAESKLGLYFTVQVGVYNTPVSQAQLSNISPLITKRLPNGQIRYSSGMFNSFIAAKPKQNEAIERGITDAFITAYFQGERISTRKAQQLIAEKGSAILELENPTKVKGSKIEHQNVKPQKKNTQETSTPFIENKATQFIYISKVTYENYPTQVINRYNEDQGLFYYDSISKNIKSFVFEETPSTFNFIEDFNKVELFNYYNPIIDKNATTRKDALAFPQINRISLNVIINANHLNSSLIETILNAPLYKEMKTQNDQLTIKFYIADTEENNKLLNNLQVKLAKLGATYISK
ncbi:hypothetical protein CW751_14620 [Brumimicrobium salinarum]|uniref:SPOR domain-containing protein n=1 Tax=Brumimicrobium salinarum TaxID=2058658 RepID=A0A2I0QYY1_9FLAO|nr:PD40 domain-containing protein [Brumimicrobium salinarum]PKR79531.1 hypothetical protein CW751_14620 [Brumimicrobium salinarum]